ncbi:glycosyltransferase [Staphylococcus arlettae]|uniref:glycosyltransferase family 2 protein n=1 Tax=Staphylococcus arlettae TaxID=29378 RepID=UPI0010720B2E|nr:glycosyltransferase family 2 protein [Staphylococcus arlettae]MBF0737096.1 glycosyltransferase family 2 protein [Staphylococcus arlettae]TFU48245.1 glycosyltransferase [Staphylococcus arlettae]
MFVRILVPCFNEAPVLHHMYDQLSDILSVDSQLQQYQYDILFVDDGSTDDTLTIIKQYASINHRVKYISFSRNFGKEAAMYAGLKESDTVDAVVIIDSDLQHPPELIPKMIKAFTQGYHQVVACRDRTGEQQWRKRLTKLYYGTINRLIDVSLMDGVGDFRLLNQKAVHAVLSLSEYNRFSKGIFAWIGFAPKVIHYQNKIRVNGVSKWSFKQLFNYAIDGLLSFNNKPLRSLIYIGALILIFSFIYIIVSLVDAVLYGIQTPGYFTTIFAITFLGSIQLVSIGIIGGYIGRIYYEVKHRPLYIVNTTNLLKAEVAKNESVKE